MNLIDEKRKLRTTCQTLIIVAMVFYLMHLELPKSFNGKAVGLLISIIVSCVGLVAIMLRVNYGKSVRRWEMIVYYLLNIVFVWVIVYNVMELCYIAEQVQIDKIPYADGTEEYYNAYDNAEEIGWIAGFTFVLSGIPSIIMTIIFAIVGIIQTCLQKPQVESVTVLDNNSKVTNGLNEQDNANTSNKLKENTQDNKKSHQELKPSYCSYCGQKIDVDAKFCKYCGKEIK